MRSRLCDFSLPPPRTLRRDKTASQRERKSEMRRQRVAHLTVAFPGQRFRQFFVSLNGSASSPSSGETKFRSAKAVRIGANDARHREHLMAPARQLTSSATLKSKGCREIRLLEVRRLVARVTLDRKSVV